MKWQTLFNRIGRQNARWTCREDVYAILTNPKTGAEEKVYLAAKHDAAGHLYLIQDQKATKRHKENFS